MKKVLIVDDTYFEQAGSFLREGLYRNNIYSEFITSAEASVLMLKSMKYDLVMMDGTFLMNRLGDNRIYAGMQGIEAIKAIREFSDIPIVMMSGEGELQKAGLAAGANDVVNKLDWDGFVTKIVSMIK
jgi:CheY-like chemotaxis protein